MTTSSNSHYQKRPLLRILEGILTRFEALLNRLSSSNIQIAGKVMNFNPLYYVDTLGIFFLIVILLTGIYLTIFYHPGADTAYQSMISISSTWFGSLMRTAHRYASQGLVIVIIVHTLKMLFSDRFWGARWLAWVSGILLVFLIWAVGVMGYFLIWDQPAQWLAEYFTQFMKGPIQMTFFIPNRTEDAFQFFVIILLLHIFLSVVIIVGMVIHEMRLQRPRVLSPRWMLITASLVLIGISLIRPVTDVLPGDILTLVGTTRVDMSYLGFLPLAQQLGVPLFWGGSFVILILACALPWIIKGRHTGPAFIRADECVACEICVKECPYNAIEMVPRHVEGHKHPTVALIDPSLCTACGLCVGDCPTDCIDLLEELPSPQIIRDLHQRVKEQVTQESAPIVVLTCQRHSELGTFPRGLHANIETVSEEDASRTYPTHVGEWHSTPVITCSVPCTGMIQTRWIKGSLEHGAHSVITIACPAEDCASREGPRWLAERLNRGAVRSTLGDTVHSLEVAPGDTPAFTHLLDSIIKGQKEKTVRASASTAKQALTFAGGLALLIITMCIAYLFEQPVTAYAKDLGQLRIAMIHTAQIKTLRDTSSITTTLPHGVTPEQVLGGERYPLKMRLDLDGALNGTWSYEPGGLSKEGTAYALEVLWLEPGSHKIEIYIMEDDEHWRHVFDGTITIQSNRVSILFYDAVRDQFISY